MIIAGILIFLAVAFCAGLASYLITPFEGVPDPHVRAQVSRAPQTPVVAKGPQPSSAYARRATPLNIAAFLSAE